MVTTKIELTKNDKGFDLEFVAKDASGVVVNLTDATVKFQLATLEYVNKINGDCVIVDANAGECKYTIVDGDLDIPVAQYKAGLQITWGTKEVSTKQFIVNLIDECG